MRKTLILDLANLFTFGNITFGTIAIYFLTHGNFFGSGIFAWLGGAFEYI